jgi:hypothetical protein
LAEVQRPYFSSLQTALIQIHVSKNNIPPSLWEMSLTSGEHISVTEEVSKPEENNKTNQVFTFREQKHKLFFHNSV